MLALSIKQPWLWAITDLDKRIENREWQPPRRVIGQRIALHASKGVDEGGEYLIYDLTRKLPPPSLPLGAVVATAVVKGFVTQSDDKWFFGTYGWILDDVVKLPEPIPCKGALGLWDFRDAGLILAA